MLKTLALLMTLLTALMHPVTSIGSELIMGYRTNERLPYIDDTTNNGIYLELYSEACRRIGATLKIVRLPKVRVNKAVENGSIDFYPGYTFTHEREQFALFLPNGLSERHLIINRLDQPPIKSYKELAGKTEIRSLGNPSYLPESIQNQVKSTDLGELGIERALRIVEAGRIDFFIYDETTLRYYWPAMATSKLRLNDSLDTPAPMYAGWSKKSPHYKTIKNTSYQSTKSLSPENQPDKLDPQSLAGKLEATLKAMSQSGETQAIVNKHINSAVIRPH